MFLVLLIEDADDDVAEGCGDDADGRLADNDNRDGRGEGGRVSSGVGGALSLSLPLRLVERREDF